MRPLCRWVFLLCLLCLPVGLAQTQTSLIFPTIDSTSVTFIAVSMEIDHLSISNNADYLYLCDEGYTNKCLLRETAGQVLLEFFPENVRRLAWSYDNKILAGNTTGFTCEKGNFFILYTENNIFEKGCMHSGFPAYTWWSPINHDELYMTLNSMYDRQLGYSFFVDPLSAPSLTLLQSSIGYLDVLWDPDTGLPLGFIRPWQKIAESHIEKSHLQACYHAWDMGENSICVPFLDTLDYSEMDVLGAQANEHWMLWYGHLGSTPREVIESSDQITDTVLYMTYLPTGETREVFRLSQLGQPHLELNTIAWSPDARTLALAVRTNPSGLNIDPNTTPLVADDPGVIILDLDWMDN